MQDVARDTNRGHTVAAVSNSFQLAKDCGFKVYFLHASLLVTVVPSLSTLVQHLSVLQNSNRPNVAPSQVVTHMVPDLPNTGRERDIEVHFQP